MLIERKHLRFVGVDVRTPRYELGCLHIEPPTEDGDGRVITTDGKRLLCVPIGGGAEEWSTVPIQVPSDILEALKAMPGPNQSLASREGRAIQMKEGENDTLEFEDSLDNRVTVRRKGGMAPNYDDVIVGVKEKEPEASFVVDIDMLIDSLQELKKASGNSEDEITNARLDFFGDDKAFAFWVVKPGNKSYKETGTVLIQMPCPF
jgi:hypothetical protein